MGKSIQDQLMKAGLANKKQAIRAKKAKNSKEKLKRSGVNVVDEAEELARKATQEQVERDRELNRQINEAAEQKAVHAQIQQIVSWNRVEERGDVEFRFTDGAVVRTLMLQERQRKALVNGVLAIVKVDDNCEIVPRPAAQKIADRDSTMIILLNDKGDDEVVDDEYAEFSVPDDLMW